MKLSRVIALFTSAALLHLSVVSGERMCASQGSADHQDAQSSPVSGHADVVSGGHPDATSDTGVRTAAQADGPLCDAPIGVCCDAMAGCSVVSELAVMIEAPGSEWPVQVRLLAVSHDAPPSFAASPEPPPPKA